MYNFVNKKKCNFCNSSKEKHKLIGYRLSKSQGLITNKRNKDFVTKIYKCSDCKLIFCNPQPEPIDEFLRYEKLEFKQMTTLQDKNLFEKELNIVKNFFKKEIKNKKSLEIGSGLGLILNKLHQNGYEVHGIEPTKNFYEKSILLHPHLKTNIYNNSIEKADFKKLYFDLITLTSVLEHLYDPNEALKKSLRWLRKGGLIHIEVPHSNWLISKLINIIKKLFFQKYVTNLSPMHLPFHYYEFSLDSFILNGKINGYKVKEYYIRESEIDFKIPKFIKYILIYLMKKTKSGKQLIVFLEKI